MIQISDRNFNLIVQKLPAIIQMASTRGSQLSLRQANDIRMLRLMIAQLKRKKIQCNK